MHACTHAHSHTHTRVCAWYTPTQYEYVAFNMMSKKNPRMPSWQCYHFETVSGFCQATNKNTELQDGDTVQERSTMTVDISSGLLGDMLHMIS